MKVTERERFMLFMSLEHIIHRYLMANTFGRFDGNEKATKHIEMSEILVSFVLAEKYSDIKHHELKIEVHDFLAENLTDYLDEKIKFPIDRRIYDYNEYVYKFFNVIMKNIDKIEKIVKK